MGRATAPRKVADSGSGAAAVTAGRAALCRAIWQAVQSIPPSAAGAGCPFPACTAAAVRGRTSNSAW